MNFIDETFGQAFIVLDFCENRISNLTLIKKKQILQIIVKNSSEKIKMIDQELKYRNEIYKDFISEQDHK